MGRNFLLFIFISVIFSIIPVLAEKQPIYNLELAAQKDLSRKRFIVPGTHGIEVFPVFVDNAIGTTWDNSISLIRFEHNALTFDVLKKDFSDYVEGVTSFLPAFSSQYMGYIQTRRFLLFNLKESTYKYYIICNSMDEHL